MKRYSTKFAVALVTILCLAGCASWQPDDVVGTWIHDEGPGRVAELTLHENGELSILGVPKEVLLPYREGSLEDLDWSDAVSGEGSWEIVAGTRIGLTIQPEGQGTIFSNLYISSAGFATVLISYLDSSDIAQFRFVRE